MLVQWLQVWVEIQIDFYLVVEDSLRLTCFKHVWNNTVFWWIRMLVKWITNMYYASSLWNAHTHNIIIINNSDNNGKTCESALVLLEITNEWTKKKQHKQNTRCVVYIVQNNMVSNTSLHLFLCREISWIYFWIWISHAWSRCSSFFENQTTREIKQIAQNDGGGLWFTNIENRLTVESQFFPWPSPGQRLFTVFWKK